MCLTWLKTYKDEISSAAAIVASAAVALGAWQFYLAREALQAQVLGTALSHGRDLYDDMSGSPDVAHAVFGVPPEGLPEYVMAQKVISFYSEQYVYHMAWLIESDDWAAIKTDLCRIYSGADFKVQADKILANGSYPDGFVEILKGCKK